MGPGKGVRNGTFYNIENMETGEGGLEAISDDVGVFKIPHSFQGRNSPRFRVNRKKSIRPKGVATPVGVEDFHFEKLDPPEGFLNVSSPSGRLMKGESSEENQGSRWGKK